MMYHDRQRAAWVTAAFVCPAALAAGGISWWAAALIALGVVATIIYVGKQGVDIRSMNLPCRIALAAWNALAAGYAAWMGTRAFPALGESPVIALTIVALAAASLHNGTAVAARVNAVLVLFLVSFLALLLAFGWDQIEVQSIMSTRVNFVSITFLVFPLAATLLPAGEKKSNPWLLCAICVLIPIGTSLVAAKEGNLYLAVESISIFGVMERVEALLSALLAAGTFSLCCLSAAGGRRIIAESGNVSELLFWFDAVVGIALAGRANEWIVLGGCLIFWGVVPLTILFIGNKKKHEKRG